MANSYVEYTGDGSTTAFAIPFDFISSSHLSATVAGVATAITVSGSTATFASAPASAAAIRITRNSSQNTRLVDYTQPSTLTEEDLDTDSKQAFFIAQEAVDTVEETIRKNASTSLWDAQSTRITNVADPVDAQDAATKNYLESTWLSSSDKTNLNTVAGISSDVSTVAGISSNVTSVAGNSSNINSVAGNSTNINTVAGDSTEINTVAGISSDVTAVAADATDIGTVAGQSAEIGRLGTSDAVADMAILGTTDVVADMAILATADVVNDMNVLGTADVVNDMNVLGTSANVTAMSTVSTNIGNVNTCATNISDITAASQAAGLQTVDNFSGNNSTTAFTLSANPSDENNTAVYIDGVYQQKNTYSVSGTTLTFSTAPPTGTNNIEVMHLSTQPTGVNPTVGTTTTGAAGTNASVSISGHELSFTIPRGDVGATGATGATGSQGPSGTIAVGTVTTGAAGSSATVTNSGTSTAATFDFSIPKGDTGAQGPTGATGSQGPAGSDGADGSDGVFSAIASQAEAEAGTDNTKGMSPLRVAQSISANAGSGGASDINGLSDAVTNSSGFTVGLGTNCLDSDDGSSNRNTGLGYDALTNVTSGSNNVGIGYQAGDSLTTVIDSTVIGHEAAQTATTGGGYDVIIGSKAAKNCADHDEAVVIGWNAGASSTNMSSSVFIGPSAAQFGDGNGSNVGIGKEAFYGVNGSPVTGWGNVAVGRAAMYGAKNEAIGNTAIGAYSLDLVDGGDYNTVVGYDAGDSITTGSNNTVIGNGGAASSATVSNEVTIGNASVNRFRIPGLSLDHTATGLGIGGAPSYKLHVHGDIYATGDVTAYSSAAAKDNISTIDNALDIVEQLRGVTFDWKDSGKKAVGLIYEEVKEVIPELTSDKGGQVGVAYQNTVALLIEAVKSLSEKVKELESKDG